MSRPKRYASAAEKQAAYRQRQEAALVSVDRVALERLHERLELLRTAIGTAAQQGNGFARRCRAASMETMLDKLIAAFLEAESPLSSDANQTE
jgi:hypothetical protein